MQRSRLLAAVAAGVALVSTSGLASAQGLDTTVTNAFKWRKIGPSNFMGRLSDVQGIPEPVQDALRRRGGGRHLEVARTTASRGARCSTTRTSSSMGMLAIAPSRHEHRLGRHGRAELAQHHRAGRRRLQVHRRRHALDAHGPREDAAHRPHRRRSAQREHRLRRGARPGVESGRRARALQDDRRRHDVEADQGAGERQDRRDRRRHRSVESRRRLPVDVGALSHAVLAELAAASGSGLFKSTDAGATWTEIKGSGYPEGPKGRIGIAISRSNPQVVYALTEAASMEPGPMTFQRNPAANGLYRSTDGGKTWTQMNNIDTRPFYYSQVRVDPKNPDRVYFSSTQLQVSNDGGKTTMNARAGRARRRPRHLDRPERSASAGSSRTTAASRSRSTRGGNFWYPRTCRSASSTT